MAEVLPKPEEEKLLPPSSARGLAGSISGTSGVDTGTNLTTPAEKDIPEYTTEPVRVNSTASPIYLIVLLLILFHFFAPRDFRDSVYAKVGKYIPVEITIKMKETKPPATSEPVVTSTPSAETGFEATPSNFEELPFE